MRTISSAVYTIEILADCYTADIWLPGDRPSYTYTYICIYMVAHKIRLRMFYIYIYIRDRKWRWSQKGCVVLLLYYYIVVIIIILSLMMCCKKIQHCGRRFRFSPDRRFFFLTALHAYRMGSWCKKRIKPVKKTKPKLPHLVFNSNYYIERVWNYYYYFFFVIEQEKCVQVFYLFTYLFFFLVYIIQSHL